MIVREPTIELGDDEAVIVAQVESEKDKFKPADLRIGVDPQYAQWLDRSATPFAPVAGAIASAFGEDVRFEAPVSEELLRGAEAANRKFAEWWGYRAARLEAPELGPEARGAAVGALFSGGMDTSATIVRSLRGQTPDRVTHLLSVYGSEWKLSTATHDVIWRDIVAAADEYELPLIRLTTNAHELLRGRFGWPRSHGASYASVALSLGPLFGSVMFGASQRPDEPRGNGSRADLIPLWSTGRTAVRVDAAELGKLGRAAVVADDPIALAHLKVCWVRDGPRNCGHCEKCLRTMTCLAVAGALERTDRFDAPLTLEAIAAVPPSRNSVPHIRELVEDMPNSHDELRDAWSQKLREARAVERAERRRKALAPLRKRWRRLRRRSRRRLRRARHRLRAR